MTDKSPDKASDMDEDSPMWLINCQIEGLLEGLGASEDHEDVIKFLRSAGLPGDTAARVHLAICCAEVKLSAKRSALQEYALDQWWFAELESIHGVCELTMDQYRAINIARKALRLSLLPTAPPEPTA